MLTFLLRRLALSVVILVGVSLLVFAVTEVLPGDAASVILGKRATPELLVALRSRLGLDRPAPLRYLDWVGGMARGDWGKSLIFDLPIRPLVLQRLRNSVMLGGLAMALAAPLGIALGVVAGLTHRRWPDEIIRACTLVTVALPGFVTGVFLIIVLSSWLRWLPTASLIEPDTSLGETLRYLVLPTLTLTLGLLAHITLMTRSSLVEVMGSDYVRTAILKGVPMHAVVLKHALPNALLPTISVIALEVGHLLGGVVLVEALFAYPGLGRLMIQAIGNRDLPLVQAIALLIAAIRALSNLAADLLYQVLNPRIRYT